MSSLFFLLYLILAFVLDILYVKTGDEVFRMISTLLKLVVALLNLFFLIRCSAI